MVAMGYDWYKLIRAGPVRRTSDDNPKVRVQVSFWAPLIVWSRVRASPRSPYKINAHRIWMLAHAIWMLGFITLR